MTQSDSPAAILSIGTSLPEHHMDQQSIGEWMAASFEDRPVVRRWLRMLYKNTGVERRYACIPDFSHPVQRSRFAPGRSPEDAPTTGERMAIYRRESVKLAEAAARRALLDAQNALGEDLEKVIESVTHLVVVSCTGFFAPGLDMALASRLNLKPTVGRTLIGFMGCAAAFNGLRTAGQIVRGQPRARVLVVCVELCSIHVQPSAEQKNLISGALFGDGASACLVGAPEEGQAGYFEIQGMRTTIKPDTRSEMVWEIGDHGFVLHLSPQIPDHLAEAAPAALEALLNGGGRPQFWAIHPGGPAIVDRLEEIFQLGPEELETSREVLRRVGNLSSATILFVLEAHRQRLRENWDGDDRVEGIAMAFGPGLVIEMAHLAYMPGTRKVVQTEITSTGVGRG